MENINFTEEQVKAAFEAAYASADEVIGNTDFLSRLEKESVARAAFMSVKICAA